jgi:carboxylesterase type B
LSAHKTLLSMLLAVLLSSLLLSLDVEAREATAPTAALPCGTVTGVWDTADPSLAVFWSIPYASPPSGQNRWKPPTPPQCLHAPFDASKPGNICYSFDLLPFCATLRPQSEDCLTLDVYTPAEALQNSSLGLPVMFWIYGGSLIFGDTSSYANLKAFASSHQVVLVAVSYRVGALGFLAHPALALEDPRGVSGNYGILDQQEALRWVQTNIGFFGGDPSQVTVIGQSSGGTSIFGLLSSPASVGLMHGAIALSGSPNLTMGLQDAYSQNINVVATRTQCHSSNQSAVLACLLAMSGKELAEMLPSSFNFGPSLPPSPAGARYLGLPIVDGVTITMDLLSALNTGLVDVPAIFQTMLAESDALLFNRTLYSLNTSEYEAYLEAYFVEHGWPAGVGSEVTSLYATDLKQSTELGFQRFLTEFSFTCGNIAAAVAAAKGFKSPVYASVVAQSPSKPLVISEIYPPCRYPGHIWDYIMATQAWNFWEVCSFTAPPYIPSEGDIAMGQSLLQQWHNLTIYHNLDAFAPSILPVNSAPVFPQNINVIIQNNTVPSMELNYGQLRCDTLAAAPLNLNQSFWMCN